MPPDNADPADKCPVDPQTREKWLEAARANKQQAPAHPPTSTTPSASAPSQPLRFSLDTLSWQTTPSASSEPSPKRPKLYRLSTDREISTIPRSLTTTHTPNAAERAAMPANSEADTGHDAKTGNWIYPSQEMFFNAMRRKGHDSANPSDMSSIVPIHNAVNERAWTMIKAWESRRGSEDPKLVSFAGDSKKLTPKARWNCWVRGYREPFDRHDWVIEREGEGGGKVDYVIDFYAGKGSGGGMGDGLNFYLDVRPKVNTWEGIMMRAQALAGW